MSTKPNTPATDERRRRPLSATLGVFLAWVAWTAVASPPVPFELERRDAAADQVGPTPSEPPPPGAR